MDPIKVDFSSKTATKGQEIVIPPERRIMKLIISLVLTVVGALIGYYFYLPPINFKAGEFYIFIGAVIIFFVLMLAITSNAIAKPEYMPYVKKSARIPFVLIGALLLVVLVGFLTSTVFFRAKAYSQIIDVEKFSEDQFAQEVSEPDDFSEIPRLDESSAANLAERAMSSLASIEKDGETASYVSQFTVYPKYTQINYKGEPYRVAFLKYANIIKWFYNKDDGLPGYIIINMADESTEFVALDEIGKDSIKYSLADHFGRHVKRVLRFEYPTYIFAEPTFEIDDSGNPYWICARLDKTIGLFGGRDVVGLVLVNAITGKCDYHDIAEVTDEKTGERFKWIDRIYNSDLLVEQYDYFGRYSGGFWNSVLGQENVVKTTEGYNYIARDDDVYLYTGVTSVTSDESITGFALINQRTKQAEYYRVNGAKEQTAKAAAEGLVLDYGFTSTFPLLLNIGGHPTYFMSLKDQNEIVQRYAMINVGQYNKIKSVGQSFDECRKTYLELLKASGGEVTPDTDTPDVPSPEKPVTPEKKTVVGVVNDIRSAVLGGESYYYIRLADSAVYYSIAASKAEGAVILNAGDSVSITFEPADDGSIISADSVELAENAAVPDTTAAEAAQ